MSTAHTAVCNTAQAAVGDRNARREGAAAEGRAQLERMLAEDGPLGFSRTARGWQYTFTSQVQQ